MRRPLLLILRPQEHFGIVGAELRGVASYGRFMTPLSRMRSDNGMLQRTTADLNGQRTTTDKSCDGNTDAMDALRHLAELCERLLPDGLYSRYANKKVFRRMEDFWTTDDSKVKDYVKRMADQLLLQVVEQADALDIPILYAPDASTPLHIEDRLCFSLKDKGTEAQEGGNGLEAVPLMHFKRHDGGITYRLTLRMAYHQEPMVPAAQKRFAVLCYEPALFIIDNALCRLPEGFSGKLLLPFVKKETVEIPKRIERDYMHRFIIRHVAKAEISAEGFDIDDEPLSPTPQLNTGWSLDGNKLLRLSFRYGDNDYAPDSPRRGRVTLSEDDEGFRFVRQLRDNSREEYFMDVLRQTGVQLSRQGIIRFETLRQMIDWLCTYAPQLRQQGFSVVQPSKQVYYIGPMSVELSDEWQGDWLQTRVTVVLGAQPSSSAPGSAVVSPALGTQSSTPVLRIPFSDLRDAILQGEQEYMLPTGERLLIPEEWMQRYGDMLLVGQLRGDTFIRHRSQVLSPTLPESSVAPVVPEDSAAPAVSVVPVAPVVPAVSAAPALPAALRATLRPYQQTGFEWLWRNFVGDVGCCLSDEMGLGKTLQTIALLLKYKEAARQPQRQPLAGCLFSEEEMRGEAASTDGQALIDYRTSLVLAPASVVHNWMAELQRFAPTLTAMSYTGDPTQRRKKRQAMMRWDVVVTSYGTLLSDADYLSKQNFGLVVMDESQTFKNHHSQIYQAVAALKADRRLALSGTPVENHLMELWSLMSILAPLLLGGEKQFQQAFVQPIALRYEQQRAELLQRIIRPYFLKRTKEQVLSDLPERQDEVVVCPMTDEQQSAYATELSKARNEWLDSSVPENRRRMTMLAALQRLRHIANGEGKMLEVFERLESLMETGHKVLIFSEYVSLLEEVGARMAQRGWQYDLLTGQTRNREQVISHFQQTTDCRFFLISLKAGGVGLNLTAADYVFVLDPWWNLAAEEQAIARAHRIGQQRPVFVYRFVSENTLEQQILQLQERKQDIIDSVMPFFTSNDQLGLLVQ